METGNNSPQPVSALIRATVFVRDLERAEKFYRALGLSETYVAGALDHPSATAVLGLPVHHPYNIRILKRPGPNYGMIGLFELAPEQQAEELPLKDGPAKVGEVALVFYVPDFDETLPKLNDAGARWLPEPHLFELGPIAQREICLRDCEGTLLNLVERDPAKQELTQAEVSLGGES